MRKIVLEPYDSIWKTEFEKAQRFYSDLLLAVEIKIEHVGSTSVEGLWAKPVLDIDIIVKNHDDSMKTTALLEQVGYEHVGNQGVEGREAFKYDIENQYIQWMNHHLYVCIEESANLRNHLLLRDHLRTHNESVEAYSRLKRELAEKHPSDIDAYIEGKTDFIIKILMREGMALDQIHNIESLNRCGQVQMND